MTTSKPTSAVERLMSKNQNTPRIMIWAPIKSGGDGGLYNTLKRAATEPCLSQLKQLAIQYGLPDIELRVREDDPTYPGEDLVPAVLFDKRALGSDHALIDSFLGELRQLLDAPRIAISHRDNDLVAIRVRQQDASARNLTLLYDSLSRGLAL